MPQVVPPAASELAAAFLQTAITLALAALFAVLYQRYRKPWFWVWAVAWLLYALRLGAILVFLVTQKSGWLYWHQVITGWTGLALLWAALVFSERIAWKPAYGIAIAFPVLWSYVAIYRQDDFLLAAGPAVIFLSGVTLWTARVFYRHHRQVASGAARFLAVIMFLWGLHHLDYPFLRAQGVWNPWGYYLDILLELAAGTGMLLLVGEDLDRGLATLSVLSEQLRPGGEPGFPGAWLERALTLPAVRGSALWVDTQDGAPGDTPGSIVAAAGTCAVWRRDPAPRLHETIARAARTRRAVVEHGPAGTADVGYIAALPVLRSSRVREVLIITGDARDPFAALDTDYLDALGQQLGAALENAELTSRLENRTTELERLAARLATQHEEERTRLSRELHDETAQVFAAIHLHLGVLRERAAPGDSEKLDRILALIGQGMQGIRSVTDRLRPPLLDDLGLLPALRGLVDGLVQQESLRVHFTAPPFLPALSEAAEVALYRALQEALSNIVRHAGAREAWITIDHAAGRVRLAVSDDGRGLSDDAAVRGTGLAGMRERLTPIAGTLTVGSRDGGGVRLEVTVPEDPA